MTTSIVDTDLLPTGGANAADGLRIEHEIAAPLARVEAAVLDPELLRRLPAFASAVAEARELSRHDHGDRIEREALYAAAVLPAFLTAVIPRAWTTWIERTEWDRRTHSATFCIEPQIPRALRRRVSCHGRYELRALSAARTARTVTVFLQIVASGASRRAEAVLAQVITRQFAAEAALLGLLARGGS